ncbi:MAG: alpha/beta hydrolase [Gemmatimonadota bacterium]|nr:alpha/beta hydrolase [Gemmatimonadota bacterium]
MKPGAILVATLIACSTKPPDETRVRGEFTLAPGTIPNVAPPRATGGYVRGPGGKRVIVFVNGLFGDALSTWTNTNGAYWPAMIAHDPDFDSVDVYVHNFQSPKLARAQQIQDLASRLKDFLLTDRVLDHDEIVFIAHSMGGLVTRAFLLKQRSRPQKTPMLYFFATPTAGANVTEIARHLSENPQLKDMQPLSDGGYVKTLREDWLQTSDDPSLNYPNAIASFCAYEILDVWNVRIVSELSATYLCNRSTRAVRAHHIGIVKPAGIGDDPYVFFKAAYVSTFGQTARTMSRTVTRAIERSPNSMRFEMRVVPLGSVGRDMFLLRQVKGRGAAVEVACGEVKKGDVVINLDSARKEEIVEVRPSLVNIANLKSSSVALVRHGQGAAHVRYVVRGLDRVRSRCPGRGRAEVVANFVTARRARIEVSPR